MQYTVYKVKCNWQASPMSYLKQKDYRMECQLGISKGYQIVTRESRWKWQVMLVPARDTCNGREKWKLYTGVGLQTIVVS